MDNNYCVYCHKNKANGKMYYGITNNVHKRWQNGSGYKTPDSRTGTIFEHAIEKYGWDGFDHIILNDNLTRDEACSLEKYYIQKYMTNVCKYGKRANGYNMTDGGDGTIGCHPSEKTRKKMSVSSKLRGISRETMELGNKARSKPVYCIETNEVFPSSYSASRCYKISQSEINSCCLGKTKCTKGTHWRYALPYECSNMVVDDKSNLDIKDLEIILRRCENEAYNISRINHSICNSKPVVCEELMSIYNSARIAEKHTGVTYKNISLCCNNKSKTAGKMHWRFASDEDMLSGKYTYYDYEPPDDCVFNIEDA